MNASAGSSFGQTYTLEIGMVTQLLPVSYCIDFLK
jgi:hypothetical protein